MIKEDEGLPHDQGRLNIRTSQVFLDMKATFEQHFEKKGYSEGSSFFKQVWFLEKDKDFLNMIRPSATPQGQASNSMHELLREVSDGRDDFKNLRCERDKFIDKICEKVYELHKQQIKSEKEIEYFNANKTSQLLKASYENITKTHAEAVSLSTLQVRIKKLDKFPEGKLSFDFHLLEINPNDITITKSVNRSLRNKYIEVKDGSEVIIFNPNETKNIFEPITFTLLGFTEKDVAEKKYDLSGTNLASFNLVVNRNETSFGMSHPETFFENFFTSIDRLMDTKSEKVTIFTSVEIHTLDNNPRKYNYKSSYNIGLELEFRLDPLTRASIFNRIWLELDNLCRENMLCSKTKRELLENYFGETLSSQIETILKRKPEEEANDNNCQCQDGCTIY